MVGENEVRVLLDKMFEIAGYSVKYDEIVNRKDEWYNGKEYLKKKAPNPEISMILVNTTWGLKVIEKN